MQHQGNKQIYLRTNDVFFNYSGNLQTYYFDSIDFTRLPNFMHIIVCLSPFKRQTEITSGSVYKTSFL